MREFVFEIEIDFENRKRRVIRHVRSKHLNGAVRKLYQEEQFPFEFKRIL